MIDLDVTEWQLSTKVSTTWWQVQRKEYGIS
jgi:hypothetical protein